jgi:hypothetical protein
MNLGKVGQPCTTQFIEHDRQTPKRGLPNFTQVCARGKVSVLEYYRQKLSEKTNTAFARNTNSV